MDPILERLIDVGGAFLILSLVVEKIADFLKLRTTGLSVRAKDPGQEKQREKGILNRNILIGIILAFFLKADAIQMLVSGAAGEVVGWENVLFFSPDKVNELTSLNYSYFSTLRGMDAGFWHVVFAWLQMLIGVGVTGVALRVGLKSWHDDHGAICRLKRTNTLQ